MYYYKARGATGRALGAAMALGAALPLHNFCAGFAKRAAEGKRMSGTTYYERCLMSTDASRAFAASPPQELDVTYLKPVGLALWPRTHAMFSCRRIFATTLR